MKITIIVTASNDQSKKIGDLWFGKHWYRLQSIIVDTNAKMVNGVNGSEKIYQDTEANLTKDKYSCVSYGTGFKSNPICLYTIIRITRTYVYYIYFN